MVDGAAFPVGTYKLNFKDYPEDRYSEWNHLSLKDDGTAKWDLLQAGTGRCGEEPSVHAKALKIGRWSGAEGGSSIVVRWENGEADRFDLDKLRRAAVETPPPQQPAARSLIATVAACFSRMQLCGQG
mmetsp:Transcript_148981/g.460105  ORF Transcript_148981/g.460105 Transcript_148981/m.460105 type:complete len:128 (+) Transcript_148981:53-436(+)